MDGPQEQMQYVGFFGVYKDSFKVIFKWKKIFTQITLSLILPLTIIFLAHMHISRLIRRDNTVKSELFRYLLFELAYSTFTLVFSLLSTTAVVYTVASVYTGRDVTYKKIMKVIPRVYKRLIVTFVFMYITLVVYTVVGVTVLFLLSTLSNVVVGLVVFLVVLILFLFGLLYLTIVWQMASVVTVLESVYGFKAMVKGKNLLKGKRFVAIGIFFIIALVLGGITFVYDVFVVNYGWMSMLLRVLVGFGCLVLVVMLFVFGLVNQTVLYLVCKSHHREMIDKLSLSSHLGVYMGENQQVIPKTKDIQLGQPQV